MAVRLFRCRRCGHRMRLTGATCGSCHAEKDLDQRPVIYAVAGLLLLLVAVVSLRAG